MLRWLKLFFLDYVRLMRGKPLSNSNNPWKVDREGNVKTDKHRPIELRARKKMEYK